MGIRSWTAPVMGNERIDRSRFIYSLNVIGEQALRQSTEAQKESLNYRANGWIAAYF